MKVGFDISQLAHLGGVATYTQNLAEELEGYKDLDMVYFYSSLRKPYRGKLSHVKSFSLPPTIFELFFNKWRKIPIEKFIGPIDIFHSSDWAQPPTKAKKVTTYHDVVALKYPHWSHPKIVAVNKRRLSVVEREIDMVIAVSEATKRDLLEVSNIPEEKVVVIYEAAGKQFRPQYEKDVEGFRKRSKLPEKFILAFGGIGQRRNLVRIKEAAKEYNLVITGETIPWLKDEELPLLYSAATAVLYPSLYEGFGLPVVEAMACGTPVITSNTSSMPEAGGGAALYVDPGDVGDIASKVREVMEDKDLRDELVKMGFLQAKKFSWAKCAAETVEVYGKLIGE